jgi:hypothetical protein
MEKPLTICEALALLFGPLAEPRRSLPLVALEQLSAPVTGTRSYTIVDTTEQFIGKAVIITGQKHPKKR